MKHLSDIVFDWACRCFGLNHVMDHKVRGMRCLEEVAEYCQFQDVTKEDLIKVIEMVYARPKGNLLQELGGIAMTFVVLCESHGLDVDLVLVSELKRVLAKSPEHFAARNAEKVHPTNG